MNNYLQEAMRTRSGDFHEMNHDLEHGIIGITTEACELLSGFRFNPETLDTTNLLEELGDICWYLAISCYGLNLSWEDLYGFEINTPLEDIELEDCIDEIVVNSGILLDHIKRIHFYGINLDSGFCKNKLKIIYSNVNISAELLDTTIEKVQEANIKKLRTRYPEKWTAKSAIQRNLDDERTVLEANLF